MRVWKGGRASWHIHHSGRPRKQRDGLNRRRGQHRSWRARRLLVSKAGVSSRTGAGPTATGGPREGEHEAHDHHEPRTPAGDAPDGLVKEDRLSGRGRPDASGHPLPLQRKDYKSQRAAGSAVMNRGPQQLELLQRAGRGDSSNGRRTPRGRGRQDRQADEGAHRPRPARSSSGSRRCRTRRASTTRFNGTI